MALCELCTRLKKHDRLKKNKTVLKLSSLHDKKKWAKLVRTFPKQYPNHSKIDGTLKPWSGTGELYVNGEKVDEDYFEFMHISTYSLAETFDVGMDSGTQVDPSYAGSPFPFTGVIDKVVATLTD